MFKKLLVVLGVCSLVVVTSLAMPARAAQFATGERVIVTENATNLYTAGSMVSVQAPIGKDLVAAGSVITVSNTVEGGILAAGSQVTINSSEVGGSVRAAGGQVTLTGTFDQDVVVFGGMVTLQNATIKGDLIVGAGTLQLNNSEVMGNAYGQYGELSGNTNQIKGDNQLKENKKAKSQNREITSTTVRNFHSPVLGWELSVVVFLAVVVWVLHRRNRLNIESIGWNKNLLMDVAVGFLSFGLAFIVFLLGVGLHLFPLAFVYLLLWLAEMFIAMFATPIYVANLLRNVWKMINVPLFVGVAIVYVVMLLFGVVEWFAILQLLSFTAFCATLGLIMRTKIMMVNEYLRMRGGKMKK